MMNHLSGIINARLAGMRKSKADKQRLSKMEEANRRVQVREFDNMLCISLDGMPIVPLKEFDKQALSDARLTFYNYINR